MEHRERKRNEKPRLPRSKMSVSQMERELGQMGVEFDDDGQVSSVVI